MRDVGSFVLLACSLVACASPASTRDAGASADASTFDASGRDAAAFDASDDATAPGDARPADALDVDASQDSGSDAGPTNACVHPDIRPAALTEYRMTWEQVFERAYPDAPGYLVPLGSFTPERSMSGPPSASMYLAIEFTALEGVRSRISFAPSQPIAVVGYTQYRPGTAFVSISPCPGDFRPPDPASDDSFLRNCRALITGETLNFGNSPDPAPHYCQLEAGRTYYLNVVFAPPGMLDGVTDSCDFDLDRCEVNSQPR
ncbi:MAG: hypothetical protein MUE69_15725 [Myxococcota bacterium]|jgi:hypothetical protein|nr:hypothetical protein [Myxococcota bacterium]